MRQSQKPGPGEYDPLQSQSKDRVLSAMIQSGERFKANDRRGSSPDPGIYHRDEFFAKDCSPIRFQGKAREGRISDVPGPGSYDPTLQAVKDAVRSINLESSLRPNSFSRIGRNSSQFPGPGEYTYTNKDTGKNVLSFTMYGKLSEQKKVTDVPGPGTYDPKPLRITSSPLALKIVPPPDKA